MAGEEDATTNARVDAATTVQGKVTGLILPPPDIRKIVDKTAQFVARNGRSFERKIAGETVSARFSFLKENDPYHAYYEHQVQEYTDAHAKEQKAKSEQAEKEAPSEDGKAEASTEDKETTKTATTEVPVETEAASSGQEEGDVVVEKKAVEAVGASAAKKMREKALSPPDEERFIIAHPPLSAVDQEIMYLTAQYTALSGKSFLAGLATREQRNPQFDFLKPTHALFAYFTMLVEKYALVLAKDDAQMKRIEEGMDRMKVLDRCVHKMEWMRQEQEKKDREAAENDAERLAIAQIDWHDFIVVETITFNDEEEAAAAAAAQQESAAEPTSDDDDMDMDMEDDEDEATKPNIKIVQDYVPQVAAPSATTNAQPLLSVDGKTVSSAEANEHMRILLMNPKWREETQRHLEKQKESSYAEGTAIADSLRRFATRRADIFTTAAEEQARLEQSVQQPTASAPPNQLSAEEQTINEAESIQAGSIAGGTTALIPPTAFIPPPVQSFPPGMGMPPPAQAPGVAPGMMIPPPGTVIPPFGAAPPPRPGFPPGPPGQGPPMFGVGPPGMPAGAMLPPGVTGPPGMGPPGAGPPGMAPPGAPLGLGPNDSEPASKRQKTEGPRLLTEQEFAALHPGSVRLTIKLPDDSDNAQWNLHGQTVNIEVDVMDTIRALKEKLMNELGGMPLNKQQLKGPMGFLKDSLTCAHYNFINGTTLDFSVRQRGGRR